jgi:hypothetical protein
MLKAAIMTSLPILFAASAATAGELTGTGEDTPLEGASICMFSGLNDDPLGLDPANGPGGRTQSYGQEVANDRRDPVNNKIAHPGNFCNPNNVPMKDIGQPG